MKRPDRSVELRDPLYKVRVHFHYGAEAALVKACKCDKVDIEPSNGAGRCIDYKAAGYGQLVVHVWISGAESLRDPFGLSVLTHECVHAACSVFKHIGAKATFEWGGDEPYAYYVEWLVREFLRRMR